MKYLHHILADIIKNFGDRFDKKHGNWYRLFIGHGLFLEMDSWNMAITLKEGDGEYCQWTGFSGKRVRYIGLDWGGFSPRITEGDYLTILEMAQSHLISKQ